MNGQITVFAAPILAFLHAQLRQVFHKLPGQLSYTYNTCVVFYVYYMCTNKGVLHV